MQATAVAFALRCVAPSRLNPLAAGFAASGDPEGREGREDREGPGGDRRAGTEVEGARWDPHAFLTACTSAAATPAMRDRLAALEAEFASVGPAPAAATTTADTVDTADTAGTAGTGAAATTGGYSADAPVEHEFAIDSAALRRLVPSTRPGRSAPGRVGWLVESKLFPEPNQPTLVSGLGFQIAAIDAAPVALWFLARYAATRPGSTPPDAPMYCTPIGSRLSSDRVAPPDPTPSPT